MPLTEEEGRIFPASMRAKDVLDAFTSAASHNGWDIKTGAKVSGLHRGESKDNAWVIELESGEVFSAHNVVIATGGITYPETGSDGSMFEILKSLVIGVTELRPALAPVYVEDYPYGELSGVSLNDVTVSVVGGVPANGSRCRLSDACALYPVDFRWQIYFSAG